MRMYVELWNIVGYYKVTDHDVYVHYTLSLTTHILVTGNLVT